ncbi:MAG: TAXI family TRAP transporter solute-binding subunit, partial [Geminicoccaceae bacterium]
ASGIYPGVQYDVNTVAVNGILVTSAQQDDELIYEITKALWSDTALEGIEGLDVPLHPGAERFYKEAGLL